MEDFQRIIDKHRRELDQKEETNNKLNITIHDLTVSNEVLKKENANLKSIKCTIETEKDTLNKEKNDLQRQLVSLKTHCVDLETQIKDLKLLLERAQAVKSALEKLNSSNDPKQITNKDLGQSAFNQHFLELLDHYERKTDSLSKEVEYINHEFKTRVDKDLDVYRKYINTIHLMVNIKNT